MSTATAMARPESDDCDDADPSVYPGAVEVCDGLDNDCNDLVDDGVMTVFYADADADGYGDDATAVEACDAPSGGVELGGDCDDADAAYNPGAVEEDCTDPNDYNCDGSVGWADDDADGWAACEDCDDADAAVNPDAIEVCDTVDNDCDGTVDEDDAQGAPTWYSDGDGDGHGEPGSGVPACDAPSGLVDNDADCDDTDAAVSPDATELCDSVDNDCDGTTDEDDADDAPTWYADSDGDGFGDASTTTAACESPTDYLDDDTDCDDTDGAVNPDAVEVCDEVDNDCDGTTDEDDAADASTWYADTDGDGYGDEASTTVACDQPTGFVSDATDCDDDDASRYSGCFTVFDGTYGSAWETLAVSTDHTYSLMVYQPDDIDDIYNMYSSSSGAAQAYDSFADTWTTQSTTVPYNSPWTSMAPWDGDLWMIRNSAVYKYEVATDTWTTEATTTAADDYNMTESDENGVIYGYDETGNIVEYDTTTSTVSYHPTGVGDEYETRLGYDPGTRGIFFGAYNSNALYRYDIATEAVTTMTSHPESQLNDIFCSDRSGHIYAAGNSSGTTIYQYDVATDTWSQIVDLPTDHGNNGSCTVSSDGWLYVGTGSRRTFYRLALY
jgi:hypothetical protein